MSAAPKTSKVNVGERIGCGWLQWGFWQWPLYIRKFAPQGWGLPAWCVYGYVFMFAVLACISQFSSQRVLFSVCAMECCGKGQYKIVSPAPTSTTCPNIKKTQCFVIVGQNANVHDHGFHLQRTAWQNVRWMLQHYQNYIISCHHHHHHHQQPH